MSFPLKSDVNFEQTTANNYSHSVGHRLKVEYLLLKMTYYLKHVPDKNQSGGQWLQRKKTA